MSEQNRGRRQRGTPQRATHSSGGHTQGQSGGQRQGFTSSQSSESGYRRRDESQQFSGQRDGQSRSGSGGAPPSTSTHAGYSRGPRDDHRGGRDQGAPSGYQGGHSHRGGDRGFYRGGDRGSYRGGDRGSYRGGDRGSYRGVHQRADSPIRTDVRHITETVETLPQFEPQNRGTTGKSVELITNHYPIEETKNVEVCHYDIDITFRRKDGKVIPKKEQKTVKSDKQSENKQIIDKMAVEWSEVPLRPNNYAYDGHKNLFTVDNLGIGENEVIREVTITLDGYPEQTYDVRVQFARNVQMNDFNTSDEFADARQVMDIVLRDRMQRSLVAVGRNLFNPDDRNTRRLDGENCSIAFGHHQSIQKTEVGLTVNVDRVTTIFRGDGPLKQFIERELSATREIREVDPEDIEFLTSRLRDLKIFTNHINGQKRKFGIEAMGDKKAYQHSFESDGKVVTVEQHFQSRYGIKLKFRELPLIKIKGGTRENPKYLPIEICQVYPNQTLPKALISREIQKQIVESTNTQTPLKRFDKIHDSLTKIASESQALMETFGLKINPHPIKLTGREVPSPKIIGHARELKNTIPLTNSVFLNLSPTVDRDLDRFFNKFFKDPQFGLIAIGKGMKFHAEPPRVVGRDLNIERLRNQIESFNSFIKTVEKGSVQLVFVCIPDKPKLYEMVKHLSENVYGIVTQCIKDNLFMNTKKGYFNNFLLKTNAKLNGQNQALALRQELSYRPRILTDTKGNTMIVGADVTHPGKDNPLAKERVVSSIAAVVGSYDMDFTKFMANVSAQGKNKEFITDFGVMFENLLKGFHKINRKYPQNIILFRDGVSDSQLDAVRIGEIPQMEAVYEKLKLAKPCITAYVVQKRHHTRIFLSTPNVDYRGNENFNMKSGTIVDQTITNPDLNEFHLCSHSGRLGTSRHAKYVEVRNDHNLSADQLQLLAFSMCFTYCRCLTPISIPIPVKYADLAAYRAKQHAAALNNPNVPESPHFEKPRRNESEAAQMDRETRNIRKLNESMEVDESLKFLPYYC